MNCTMTCSKDLYDEPEPSCEEGWYSFNFLKGIATNLTQDQLRDRLEASVRKGTREKRMWCRRAYYRKI